jgi:hypothetical protein
MAQTNCSFCGRSKKEVTLMLSGINAHICGGTVGARPTDVGINAESMRVTSFLLLPQNEQLV